jgi:hypothetical protein
LPVSLCQASTYTTELFFLQWLCHSFFCLSSTSCVDSSMKDFDANDRAYGLGTL